MKYSDIDNSEIEMTDDRREHKIYFHPEIELEMNFIKESLNDLD